jgi:hypothetical protein
LDAIEATVAKPSVIPREVGRVDAELDRTSDSSRAFYFLKSNFDPSHPFARFAAGSRETLETQPKELGLDVAAFLLRFFRDHYVASRATLVVIGNEDLRALDRWVSPFSSIMSQRSGASHAKYYPEVNFDKSSELVQTIILRSNEDAQVNENIQTLAIEWPLSLVYQDVIETRQPPSQHTITASAVGFVVSQIISRRGVSKSHLLKIQYSPLALTIEITSIDHSQEVSGHSSRSLTGYQRTVSRKVYHVFHSLWTSMGSKCFDLS